jgi:hypothetical protein
MMKIPLILIILIIFIINTKFEAQNIIQFGNRGTFEVGGSLYYSNITPINNGTKGAVSNLFQLQPIGGYFISKGIEIGIQPSISITNSSGSSFTQTGIYLTPAYNFILKSKIYPVIEALIGYSTQSGSDVSSASGFSWGIEGGVKFNLMGNSLLFVGLQYRQDTYNASGATSRSGLNIFTFGAGWNVFF